MNDKLFELCTEIELDGDKVEKAVETIIKDSVQELDDYVIFIKGVLQDYNNPPTNLELDDMIMQLPTLLYFTGNKQEMIGIKEDISTMVKKEMYSKAYNNSSGKVDERRALASLETKQEELANVIYQRAYKKVKIRMDMAHELLQSIKKVISRRMAEAEISNVDSGGTR